MTTTTTATPTSRTTIRCRTRGCPGRGRRCPLHGVRRYPVGFVELERLLSEKPYTSPIRRTNP